MWFALEGELSVVDASKALVCPYVFWLALYAFAIAVRRVNSGTLQAGGLGHDVEQTPGGQISRLTQGHPGKTHLQPTSHLTLRLVRGPDWDHKASPMDLMRRKAEFLIFLCHWDLGTVRLEQQESVAVCPRNCGYFWSQSVVSPLMEFLIFLHHREAFFSYFFNFYC